MVNLMALMEGAHYCLPHMQQVGGGAIVATSSVQALVGVPGHPAYGAAKAGILGAVRSMAVELWPYKVRVNAVCPGGTGGKTWTVIDELGEEYLPEFEARFGREMRHLPLPVPTDPMAIAQAALFLAADEAGYITGQHLSVDAAWACYATMSSTDPSRSTRRRPEASEKANCKPNLRRGWPKRRKSGKGSPGDDRTEWAVVPVSAVGNPAEINHLPGDRFAFPPQEEVQHVCDIGEGP